MAALSLRSLYSTPWPVLCIFAGMLFNPVSFDESVTTRVIREGIYPALALLVVATALGFFLRAREGAAKQAPWSIGLAAALSTFWLTREDGLWLVPFLALVLSAVLFAAFRNRRQQGVSSTPIATLGLCLLPIAFCAIAISAVQHRNLSHYGVSTATEFRSKGFKAAINALTRVKHATPNPFHPIPKEARLRIYPESEEFSLLGPHLEGAVGNYWSSFGCDWADGCEDLNGGWAHWALRVAAVRAGKHETATQAENYYLSLAAEVERACDEGRLACGEAGLFPLPPWQTEHTTRTMRALGRGFELLRHLEPGESRSSPWRYGSIEAQKRFHQMVNEPREVPREYLRVWAMGLSRGATVDLAVQHADGSPAEARILSRLATPELYQAALDQGLRPSPAIHTAGFEITTDCIEGCRIELSNQGEIVGRVYFDYYGGTQSLNSADVQFQVTQSMRGYRRMGEEPPWNPFRRATLETIALLYQVAIPWLFALTLLLLLASTAIAYRERSLVPSLLIQWALVGAIFSRLLVMAAIDATLFPGMTSLYLSPIYPLLLLLIGVTFASRPSVSSLRRGAREYARLGVNSSD